MNQRTEDKYGGSYDQSALDAASREVHMMLLREGSSWGTKACEEMGRVFMTAYLKSAPPPTLTTGETPRTDEVWDNSLNACFSPAMTEHARQLERELAEAKNDIRNGLEDRDNEWKRAERAEARVRKLEAQPPSAAAPQSAVGAPTPCAWTPDDDGVYHTDCDNAFTFIDAGPKENSMVFCCYCGGNLVAPTDDAGSKG